VAFPQADTESLDERKQAELVQVPERSQPPVFSITEGAALIVGCKGVGERHRGYDRGLPNSRTPGLRDALYLHESELHTRRERMTIRKN
jgi:hypothetical protein